MLEANGSILGIVWGQDPGNDWLKVSEAGGGASHLHLVVVDLRCLMIGSGFVISVFFFYNWDRLGNWGFGIWWNTKFLVGCRIFSGVMSYIVLVWKV